MALAQRQREISDADLPPSEPVIFDGFTGIYQAAANGSRQAVLMLSPTGFEELCNRASWTSLADELAAAGFASLRFDYPGTANALDTTSDGLDDWRVAAGEAARYLRERSGHTDLILCGQSLGATLALTWSAGLGPIGAAVLLEPALAGRTYLRGLKAWGTAVALAAGTGPDPADTNGHGVAGLLLSDARLAAIRALDLRKIERAPVSAALLLEQSGGLTGKVLAEHLTGLGVAVERGEFTGYGAILTDPTSAQIPSATIDSVVAWLTSRFGTCVPRPASATRLPLCPAALEGDGFRETPIRFGPDRRLVGVLCQPNHAPNQGRALVIANAGRDYHMGWARSAVEQARTLARAGTASLRFDIGGIGDSRAAVDAPAEIIYSRQMCDDLRAAVDHLEACGYPSISLLGRCSGAWAAFTVASEDDRIGSVALVNTGYFLWDPSKTLADVIRFAQRKVGDLGHTLLRRDGLRRLLRGQLDVRGAIRFLGRQANRHLLRRNAALLGRLTSESRRYHDVHALFARLRRKQVPVLLAYSEGDSSIDELRSFMGSRLQKLARYPNVTLRCVVGADHNFTHRAARADLLEGLIGFLQSQPVDRGAAPNTAAVETLAATRLPYDILAQSGRLPKVVITGH